MALCFVLSHLSAAARLCGAFLLSIQVRSLQGRILHLLVTVSSELQSEASYGHALKAGLEFLQSPDVVLALYGVKLLHKLCLADILRKGVKSVQVSTHFLLFSPN